MSKRQERLDHKQRIVNRVDSTPRVMYKTHIRINEWEDRSWRGAAYDARTRKMIRMCSHEHREERRAYQCAREMARIAVPELIAHDRKLQRRGYMADMEPSEAQLRVRAAYAAGIRCAAYGRAKANEILREHGECDGVEVEGKDSLSDDETFVLRCRGCEARISVIVCIQVEKLEE